MFSIPSDPKKSFEKAMLNKNVNTVYHPKKKSIVKDMKLTSLTYFNVVFLLFVCFRLCYYLF